MTTLTTTAIEIGFRDPRTGQESKKWILNSSQRRFWKAQKKFVLFSGGFGCGKSLMLILKAIEMAVNHPNNYILMGRKTYPELRDTLWKDFQGVCPEFLIESSSRAEMRITFRNKSEIIFRHLDTIAESEIRSMNLGAAFIDQAEDIPKDVFLGLRGRLRREGVPEEYRRIYMSCNPSLTWLFADFKQHPLAEYEVIEASTLENAANLPDGYVKDLMKYPLSWRRQYVEGVWDTSLMSDRLVFAREYIQYLLSLKKCPIETKEGLDIYYRFSSGHRYQMGIDAAEGLEQGDEAAITITDLCCLREAASWSGRVPPDVTSEYALRFARWYSDEHTPITLLPEMNSVGLAVLNRLQKESSYSIRIYRREEFDKTTGEKLEREGWRTTASTKALLISRFQELLRLKNPEVYSEATLEQFKSFVYTDEAKKKGSGAEKGFHDDRVISCLLSFWEKSEVLPGKIIRPRGNAEENAASRFSKELKIVKGKIMYKQRPRPILLIGDQSWQTR